MKEMLESIASEIWFKLLLNNLKFNGTSLGNLIDDDVTWQLENLTHIFGEFRSDEHIREILDLIPKATPGFMGHVSADMYPCFRESSVRMVELFSSLFKRNGLDNLLSPKSIF